jgi:hypothetical protein
VNVHGGSAGVAQLVPGTDSLRGREIVCQWLITAPFFHPDIRQWLLGVIRLREVHGMAPAYHHYLDSTHEFLISGLDPTYALISVEQVAAAHVAADQLHMLNPVSVCHQFIASDTEMAEVAESCAFAICQGQLTPETISDPALLQAAWLSTLVKSLAHVRGEVHAP